MKSLKENPILFLILFCLFLLCRKYFLFLSLFFCALFWYLRTKDHSVIIVASFFLLACVPFYPSSYPTMQQGSAIIVKANYAVLAKGNQRLLVYTQEPFVLDGDYAVSGSFEKITETKGFFRFDAEAWANDMGAYYSTDGESCTLVKERWTFRRQIQKCIDQIEDPLKKQELCRILLNIASESENESSSFLYEHGFSYAGMLAVWNIILKYFLDQKKRKNVLTAVNIGLIVIYHAPMLLVQSLLFRLFSTARLSSAQKTSLCLSIILLLYPGSLMSLSFLIPAVYRLSFLIKNNRRKTIFYTVLCMQSIILHHINPIEMVFYPVNLMLVGILWRAGIFTLFFSWFPYAEICSVVNQMNSLMKYGTIYGSMLGFGLLIYVLLCFCFYKRKYRIEIFTVLLFVFQYTGLFHPFAEVTAVNVGQGDSILIREPFNLGNVLIDTGKPSQWNALNDYLHAKSIEHIDTLVITHSDNDHSGNMNAVIEEYHPSQIVTEHQECIHSGSLVFYDLNEIKNDDENESSLVLACQINHLKYLFMADADRAAEEKIVQKYDQLECDVLKLSHHGSNTGSCSKFLDTVKPKIGLISSGAYQIYHHPSPETIQQLLKRHIEYFDTKETGDISIIALPGMNLLITADGKLGIIK